MHPWRFTKSDFVQTSKFASKYVPVPHTVPYYVKLVGYLPIISGLLVPRFFRILTIVAGSAGKLSLVGNNYQSFRDILNFLTLSSWTDNQIQKILTQEVKKISKRNVLRIFLFMCV